MIAVFRVVLRIESGEAATLAYWAIKAPKARWDVVREVLEKDNLHIHTPFSYDELIDEFHVITDFRNTCAHGLWEMDNNNQPWLSRMREPIDAMKPRRVIKSEFGQMLDQMRAFRDKVISVSTQDRLLLDKRWSERSRQVHGNTESTRQEDD